MSKKLMILSIGLVLLLVLISSVVMGSRRQQNRIVEHADFVLPQSDLKSPCYWLWNYASIYYFWEVPEPNYGELEYAERFSVTCCETLMGVNVYIYEHNDGSFGDDDVIVTIYGDDGSGLPGLIMGQVTVPAGSYNAYPTPSYFNFSALNLVVCDDFHVGVTSSGIAGSGWENIMSDDGLSGGLRSSVQITAGVWDYMAYIWGVDVDWAFEVYLCSGWSWSPGDAHKMHFPQLPDESGWDVDATAPLVLADDWQCSETGWVKDIHWWGSWMHGYTGVVDTFVLSVHKDIPAGVPGDYGSCVNYGDCNNDGIALAVADLVHLIRYITNVSPPRPFYPRYDFNGDCIIDSSDAAVFNDYFINGMSAFAPYGGYPIPTCCAALPYSRPGETLWEKYITNYGATPIDPPTPEGWYDPSTEETLYDNHWAYFQYDVCLPESLWFWQDKDTIYWLNISAIIDTLEDSARWGWKSSYMHWNDDAVWAWWGSLNWQEMYEPGTAYNYIPGDIDGDGDVDNDDALYFQNWYYSAGPPPPFGVGGFYPAADVNGDCIVDLSDLVYLVQYIAGGPPPIYCSNYAPACINNNFNATFDLTGNLVNGGGTNPYGQGWYFYEWYGWWNIWFYDHSFDTTRKKTVHIEVDFIQEDPGIPAFIEFAVNWSTDEWSWNYPDSSPPLPGENEDMYIGRHTLFLGTITESVHMSFDYTIPWYNPEWISIDIIAENITVVGSITHCCLQSMDLSFVITGEPPDGPPPVHLGDINLHNVDDFRPLDGDPIGTLWHELWPNFCEMWQLTSWFDNGDGILSVCDYVDFTNEVTGEWRKYHLEWIGPTLTLEWGYDTIYVEYICNEYPLIDTIFAPMGTWWFEKWPDYYNIWHIIDWVDNGNGYLDSCDWIIVQNWDTDEIREVHVVGVDTDILLNEIVPTPPEPLPEGTIYHNTDDVDVESPMGSIWHELYPTYCQYWELTSWFDNGDSMLSVCDYVDFTNTADSSWKKFHIEWIGWTIELTKEGSTNPIYMDWYDGVSLPLDSVIGSYWHEVYPNYCTNHFIVDWIDNGTGVLDSCDYLIIQNMETGWFEEYHVEGIKLDIILDEVLPEPPERLPGGINLHNTTGWLPTNGSPIESSWHELWPNYCHDWELSGWIDNGDGKISVCDTVGFNWDESLWYHVEWVGPTIVLEDASTTVNIYLDYSDFDNPDVAPITNVVGTYWHEVYPVYCQNWYIVDWIDNGSGVLDSCDWLVIQNMQTGQFETYHVIDVQTDMIIRPIEYSFPVHWRYHPSQVNGWLTVYGTYNCHTMWPPLFTDAYVYQCNQYSGPLPRWYNDYLIRFAWDYSCGNVDYFKVAIPYYTGGIWTLLSISDWVTLNVGAGQSRQDSLTLPTLGDETGETQNIYTIVNLEEWQIGKKAGAFPETYEIVDGVSPDLPGYLIGTSPIVFDPNAPNTRGGPFSTDLFSGTLTLDGDMNFDVGGDQCDCEPGNSNGDALTNIFDVTYLITYLYKGGPGPTPFGTCSGDPNCDCLVNIFDITYVISYLYKNGPAPCICEEWLAACGSPLQK